MASFSSRLPARIVLIALLLTPGIWQLILQHRENLVLDSYLTEVTSRQGLSDRDYAITLSQAVRSSFEVDRKQFTRLDMSNRTFLREDSEQLLDYREGQCGEGTRLLVNLLRRVGLDATRVSLYDVKLHSSHTLVSLVTGGEEYFIDTLNTQADMNDFLNTHQVNASSFSIVRYSDNVMERVAQRRELAQEQVGKEVSDEREQRFFDRFRYYSYEALPFTKLFNVAGLNTRAMILDRPPGWVSSLAEKPHLIVASLLLSLGLAAVLVIELLRLSIRRRR